MVVDFHNGSDRKYQSGGRTTVSTDHDTVSVVLALTTEDGTIQVAMVPDEAVAFAVDVLRERNLLVTGSG